jgi:hypothetical protein
VSFVAAVLVAGCALPGQPPQASPGQPPQASPGQPPQASPGQPPQASPGQPPQASPRQGPSPFPTREALEELSDSPEPVEIFRLDIHPVDEWTLEGPFPEQVGALPSTDTGPWGALLHEAARRRAGLVLPSEGMNCVARELGRFYLAHRGQPPQALKRFIAARCHTSVTRVGTAWVSQDVPVHYDEGQVFTRWKQSVQETLERHLGGGPRTAGIWYGKRDDHVVVMVAYGIRTVQVEPFDPFAVDGRVELRGEVLENVAEVTVRVNRGRFGVAECEQVEDSILPRFHFVCEVDPGDVSAYLSVDSQRPGRLLGTPGILALIWPGSSTTQTYRRPGYAESWPVIQVDEMPDGLVALLNQIRGRAGLDPVELDVAQSELAEELAPHFFSAAFGQNPEAQMDLVVLGMMAGWRVEGMVEAGRFTAAWTMRSNDLGDLISESLAFPAGREVLLDARADRLAVGPMLEIKPGRESMAAVFGTYALFTAQAHDSMARRVYGQLESERRARGRSAPERLVDVTPLCHEAAMRVQAGLDPSDVMSVLIRESSNVLRRPVSGWIAEVADIEELEFPTEYLEDPSLAVAVAVGHRKREGEPWGRYVVLLVVAAPESRGA